MITLTVFALPGSVGASTATLGLYLALRLYTHESTVIAYSDEPHADFARREITVLPRVRYAADGDEDLAIVDLSDSARPRTVVELGTALRGLGARRIALAITDGAPRSEASLSYLCHDPTTPTVVLRRERLTAGGSSLRGKYELTFPELEPEAVALIESGPAVIGYAPRTPLRRWLAQWVAISERLSAVSHAFNEVNVTR